MSHNDFSKCRIIRTIDVRTKVLAIKFMSLYNNLLEIIILLFAPFEINLKLTLYLSLSPYNYLFVPKYPLNNKLNCK